MVSSGAEKTRGRTCAGTHLGTGFRACLARERGRGDPSGLLGLRSAGHARSHDHAGGAAGGPLAGNPAPATIIRAAASPGRERAGEREGCRAHVADTRARSRVRSMRGPSRYVSEQTPSRKVAYHRARAGITASPRPVCFAGFFPRDERTLSPAFRRDATSFPERNVRVADVQWALPNDDAPVRGAGRVRRLVCTPVRPSVSRDTPRRARVHPETGLEVPVFFLTTQFLYGTTFAGTAQPFVLDTWSIITGWRKISGALIGH